jgi:hypothetical protein
MEAADAQHQSFGPRSCSWSAQYSAGRESGPGAGVLGLRSGTSA